MQKQMIELMPFVIIANWLLKVGGMYGSGGAGT
jgi:hypothetical protein